MIERMKTSQALFFLTLSVTMFLSAQDQPDMTILFDYFDSTVTIYVDNDEIVIEGDGVPSHLSPYFVQTYGQTQNGFYYWLDSDGDGINDLWMQTPANMNLNPNRIAQQGYEFRIPLYPAINPNGPTDTFLGPIGVSINGVPFFNEYESPTETLTNQVIQSFDPGNGHPAPQGRYHYHFPPESLITVTEDNFLGFSGDGFPVYGPKNPDGNNAQNLDDYHGEFGPTPDFPDSIYHYHTNFTSPYIIGAFAGTLGTGFGGGGGGRSGPARGSDLQYQLDLSLEDAVRGTETRIRVPARVRCDACSGSGAKSGTSPTACATCGSRGQVRMQQGFFSIQQTCPQCRGSGKVIGTPCTDCGGQGRVQKTKTLQVKVPAGVDEGDQIRLAGEGEAAAGGGASGDLYVQIGLKPHSIFSRDGDNLYCEVPVSFSMATLGGSLGIPTLGGRANLKIPPESQSEQVFRLRGKGVRNVRNGAVGDLFCKMKVETPVNLTRKQKELLSEFDRLTGEGGDRHRPREGSWTGKLKSFFEDIVS